MVLFGGACVVLFGRVCMVLFGEGMCGFISGGCAWFYLGGHAWFNSGEVCVVLFRGGVRGFFSFFRIQWDTVNERAVRILLECILVFEEVYDLWKLHNQRNETGRSPTLSSWDMHLLGGYPSLQLWALLQNVLLLLLLFNSISFPRFGFFNVNRRIRQNSCLKLCQCFTV